MDRKKLEEADIIAENIIQQMMISAGALGFLPGAGFIISTVIDFTLVERIATAYGVADYNYEAVMAVIGATLTGKFASSLILSFIPILGWAINAGVAATVTAAAGQLLRDYFRERSPYAK